MTELTQRDQLVFGALFDSESSTSNVAKISTVAPSLPGITAPDLERLQSREREAISRLDQANPDPSEIEDVVAQLTAIINGSPNYASAYCNRAQATKLLLGDDLSDPKVAQSTLYQDLCDAIRLASPVSGQASVSAFQSRILASAFTLRASIIFKCSRHLVPRTNVLLPCHLRSLDQEGLESLAASDFQLGGKYGNKIARQMAVQLNPYARMCGAIVKEALIADMKESMAVGLM